MVLCVRAREGSCAGHLSEQLGWRLQDAWAAYSKTVQEIRAAKKQGLRVVLILRIYLAHYRHPENKYLWHGIIAHTSTMPCIIFYALCIQYGTCIASLSK